VLDARLPLTSLPVEDGNRISDAQA
jgi:hypothetical protein